MPLALSLLLLMAVSLFAAERLPAQQALQEEARGGAAAASFLAYREAVLDFLNANPGFVGTASDAALQLPWGARRDGRWGHVVLSGGSLYVFQTAGAPAPLLLDQLQRRTLNSVSLGRKAGGELASLAGGPGLSVPALIPDGAVVLVGR